ncbi:hypothetical protein Tco_0153727 [Tanacetum coccineum]
MDSQEGGMGSFIWNHQSLWQIRSWRLYTLSNVHVLETVSREVLYMFVDVSYPLSVKLMERMLKHKFEIDNDVVGNDMTTAEQLIWFIKNQIAAAQVFNSPMLHLLRVEMVINSPWIMPLLGTKGLASPEQMATGLASPIVSSYLVKAYQIYSCCCGGSKSVAGSRFPEGILMKNKDVASSRDIQLICAEFLSIQVKTQADWMLLQSSYFNPQVPTGRVVVPTGRYVVPAGKVIIIVSPGRLSLVPTGRVLSPELSLKDLKARNQGHARTVVILEPGSGRIQSLPEVQGKGKEKIIDEQVAHTLLDLNTPKKKSVADQYILQKRTPESAEPTGPSLQPEDEGITITNSETESDEIVTPVNKEKDASNKELIKINAGVQDEGQAGSNLGKQDEGQAGSNPRNAVEFQPQQSLWLCWTTLNLWTLSGPVLLLNKSCSKWMMRLLQLLSQVFRRIVILPTCKSGDSCRNHANWKPCLLYKILTRNSASLISSSWRSHSKKNQRKPMADSSGSVNGPVPHSSDTSFCSTPGYDSQCHNLTLQLSLHTPNFTVTTKQSQQPITTLAPPPPQPKQSTTNRSYYNALVDEIVTDAVDWALQAPLHARFKDLPEADMKEDFSIND